MTFKVRVPIRDGRIGREGGRAGVSLSGKGAILHKFETDEPPELDIGDAIVLGDGTKVVVIGTEESLTGQCYEHTVYVRNAP
jgi:hypothetical protein